MGRIEASRTSASSFPPFSSSQSPPRPLSQRGRSLFHLERASLRVAFPFLLFPPSFSPFKGYRQNGEGARRATAGRQARLAGLSRAGTGRRRGRQAKGKCRRTKQAGGKVARSRNIDKLPSLQVIVVGRRKWYISATGGESSSNEGAFDVV